MADLILKAGLAGKSQQQLIINTTGSKSETLRPVT